jgi:hypothetical protein
MGPTVLTSLTVAMLLSAVVPPAAAPGPRSIGTQVVIVEDRGVIAPSQTAGFSERCPARAPHAVGATYGPTDDQPLAGQLLLTASFPLHRAGWRVVLKNLTPLPQPFFAGAVCLGSAARFAYPETTGVAAPGMDDGFSLRCPARAPNGIGGFFSPQDGAGLGQLGNDSSFPTKTGWDIGVRNIDRDPHGYFAGAVCVGAPMATALLSRTETVAAGARIEIHLRCPRRAPQPIGSVVAAGDAAARGQILATDAFRAGARTWNTGVRNVSTASQRAGVGVICVR